MAENFCMHSKKINEFVNENFNSIRAPFSAGIELTAKCNLNCIHCYAKPNRKHNDMTTDEFKFIFDTLIEHGLIEAYFTGGEIFTRSDFEEIYVYAKKKGVLIALLTNITLLNEHLIELFKEYPVETISTTMYGYTEETYEKVTGVKGSYKMFMNALELLQKNNIPFELKYVAMKQNFNEVDQAREFGKKLGVPMMVSMNIHAMNDGTTDPVNLRMTPQEVFDFDMNDTDRRESWENMAKSILAGEMKLYPERASKRFAEGFLYPCSIACQEVFITSDCKMQGCVRVPYYQFDLRKGTFDDGWEYLRKTILEKKASSNYKCLTCQDTRFCEHCVGSFMLAYGDEEHVDPFSCEVASLRKQFVYSAMKKMLLNTK